ncbi:putative nucleotide-sugar transporter Ymd8p [[Candida] jaroonii]|uniref:Nucleotide-sugar transporter Ymd8p n=1 Tax=[Candida] jaroonii TaxID=467808 RepID=A0ACA9Y486_9ASCO|nr:putative nucleotide-sugar transporter Ymd8p [[Candida] jaroonii]
MAKSRIQDSSIIEDDELVHSFQEVPLKPPHNHYKTGVYILGWYFFSMSISIYNKWMFGDGLNFKFPIIITSFHQLCLFILSSLVLYFNPSMRPSHSHLERSTESPNDGGFNGYKKMFHINWLVYIKQFIPCSIASAGDIGLSNVSIIYISLSLYTMLKTSSLMFVLIFGLIFKLEKFNWRLIIIVMVMTFSVLMMVSPNNSEDHKDNNSFGVFLVLLASVMSGLRWSFTQLLLKNNPHTPNTITTIFYLSPSMSIGLFFIGLMVEGGNNFRNSNIWQVKGIFQTIILMIIPGILAFMMTLSEFKLLKVSQVITLSIAGIFKELLTIVISSFIFGDRLSWINIIGLVITFIDILWYNWFRFTEAKYKPVNIEMRNLQ